MLTVFGSTALDTIRTPTKTLKNVLGGAATYAAISSSNFVKTGLIAVVGEDFSKKNHNILSKYLDLQGLTVSKGKTFRYDGKYDNTLIIFSSDNGPTHIKHVDIDFFNSAGPFLNSENTVKGNLNEGGIRVPTIVTWPKVIPSGSESNHPSVFYDYLATVSDLVGVSPPYKTDGISFLPTLKGINQEKHKYLYWEFPSYGGQQAIRIDKWKGAEWDKKVLGFERLFQRNNAYLNNKKKAICLGARTGQEVFVLRELGLDTIGIDLVPFPPYTVKGDIHNLSFKDKEFDFVFTNIFN